MLGRMISASVVQEHFQNIVNAAEGDALQIALDAAEGMSLITIDKRSSDGTPTGITWINL